jgi:hypothetical protein
MEASRLAKLARDREYSKAKYALKKADELQMKIDNGLSIKPSVDYTPVKLPKTKKKLILSGDESDAFMNDVNLLSNSKALKLSMYKKLRIMFGGNLALLSNDLIIKSLTEKISNPNTLTSYLVVVQSIKKHYELPITELVDSLIKIKERRIEETKCRMVTKVDVIPKYTELIKKLKSITDPKSYVINYLMLTFGVRNKDVDVFITDNPVLKDNINYLLLDGNKIKYVINDYKTQKSYGSKTFVIKDKKFIEMVGKLKMNEHILVNMKGKRVTIAGLINKLTIDGISESDIFRSIIAHIRKKKNFGKLLQFYSDARGTDINTIMSNYNITTDSLKM